MMKHNILTTITAPALAAGVLLAGCAKDMNADDYKEKILARDTAKLLPAVGKFTGNLKSLKSGANIGAVAMELKVDTKPQGDTSDPNRASAKPVLKLFVTLEGALSATVTATDSYFDPGTGHFRAAISVKRQAPVQGPLPPQDAVINIDGTITADGAFSGVMDANEGNIEYKDEGASFALRRGGPSLEQINKASAPDQSVFFTQANHAGRAKFLGLGARDDEGHPITKPVNLVLLKPSRTNPDQDFVELLLPTKPVLATLNFSDTARFQFGNAILDRRTGILKADTAVDTTTASGSRYVGTLSLKCDPVARGEGFECRMRTNGASDEVAVIEVVPHHGPTEPTEPLKSPPKQYFYYGRGKFPVTLDKIKPGEKPKMEWKNITFMATYDGKTLDEEIWDMLFPTADKFLQVSFGFTDLPPTGGNPNWGSARFTRSLGKLVAKGSGIVPGSWMTLDCDGFNFQSPKLAYNYKCIYISSVNNVPCPLEFKSR